MHTYELVLVFDPNLENEQIETELRRFQEIIAADGTTRRWERWGKRRLTYEIRGRQYGYYALAMFDLNTAAVAELDRLVRISPTVIRHLITLLPAARAPEIDAEAVRTLGATAPASIPDGEVAPTGEAAIVEELPVDDIVPEPTPEVETE
ncbi:30S ribosomal protein S6 [candidate division KSB1 bacterium]|nr:30S ribosomal protein S6 [candidate division KSB1 bacterium]